MAEEFEVEEAATNRAARLVVERSAPDDIKMRDLYVTVDRLPEKTLRFGGRMEVDLPEGEHEIVVTNRVRTDRVKFSVASGETIAFDAVNVATRGMMNFLAVFTGMVMYRPVLRQRSSS